MSTDLLNLLDLPSNFDVLKLVTISSDDLNNSSFALHSIIQSRVRSRSGRGGDSSGPFLVLILINQSYFHYATVAAKAFGLNLKALKDKGDLLVIDLLTDFDKYQVESKFDFPSFSREVFNLIETRLQETSASSSPCVIIDDISSFLSLGVNTAEIYKFVSTLRSFSFKYNFSLVVQTNYVPEEDDEDEDLKIIAQSSITCSDVWIHFSKLETGFSQQVDGNLVLHDLRRKLGGDFLRKFHFKTLDRNTKLFVPGNVSLN